MIKTERLILAPFDMRYLRDYFDGFNEEIAKYQWPDPFESVDDARDTLQGFLREMERGETLFFSVLSKDGVFLGSVEIHGLNGECPELGVWITTLEQSKGYAYEALCAALNYAGTQFGRYEFFYEADVRNEASVRLLCKLGADYEIVDLEPESTVTDSGKELILMGHILKAKNRGA